MEKFEGGDKLLSKIKSVKNEESVDRIMFKYLENNKLNENGLWLEFGVYKGETIRSLSKYCNKIYGFDSFRGLPEDWIIKHEKGKFNMNGIKPDNIPNNVELIVGLFEETLDNFIEENIKDKYDKITFINFDCDLYSSTKTILDKLKDYIKSGTILYFDEFMIDTRFDSECKAFLEYVKSNNINYEVLMVNGFHQIVIKII